MKIRELIHEAKKSKSLLFLWNRGLGDIPLGLFRPFKCLQQEAPDCKITVLTRPDLVEGFELVPHLEILSTPALQRGAKPSIDELLKSLGRTRSEFDLIVETCNPTKWGEELNGSPPIRLELPQSWMRPMEVPKKPYVGVHVQTETHAFYGYDKNWPLAYWQELFRILSRHEIPIMLFGMRPHPTFPIEGICDMRGKTNLRDLCLHVKDSCRVLIAPDSGVLSLLYFIDLKKPLHLISLWADPRQGIFRENAPSPNQGLKHTPFIAEKGELFRLPVADVARAVLEAYDNFSTPCPTGPFLTR